MIRIKSFFIYLIIFVLKILFRFSEKFFMTNFYYYHSDNYIEPIEFTFFRVKFWVIQFIHHAMITILILKYLGFLKN